MDIRPHSTDDFAQIAELRWHLKTDDGVTKTAFEKAGFAQSYLVHLQEAERVGDTFHWVIEGETELLGVATIRLVRKEPSLSGIAGAWGYLTNVIVREPHRNKGLGSRLLSSVIDWARASGLELLIVWPGERSYAFYRRAGFVGQDDPLQLELQIGTD